MRQGSAQSRLKLHQTEPTEQVGKLDSAAILLESGPARIACTKEKETESSNKRSDVSSVQTTSTERKEEGKNLASNENGTAMASMTPADGPSLKMLQKRFAMRCAR